MITMIDDFATSYPDLVNLIIPHFLTKIRKKLGTGGGGRAHKPIFNRSGLLAPPLSRIRYCVFIVSSVIFNDALIDFFTFNMIVSMTTT